MDAKHAAHPSTALDRAAGANARYPAGAARAARHRFASAAIRPRRSPRRYGVGFGIGLVSPELGGAGGGWSGAGEGFGSVGTTGSVVGWSGGGVVDGGGWGEVEKSVAGAGWVTGVAGSGWLLRWQPASAPAVHSAIADMWIVNVDFMVMTPLRRGKQVSC
jgi:hypothetical protein